jgi:hypothetical protein
MLLDPLDACLHKNKKAIIQNSNNYKKVVTNRKVPHCNYLSKRIFFDIKNE